MSDEAGRTALHAQIHNCMYTSRKAGLRRKDSDAAVEVCTSLMCGLCTCGCVRFAPSYLLRVLDWPAVDLYVASRIGSLEHSSLCHFCCCGLWAPSWSGSGRGSKHFWVFFVVPLRNLLLSFCSSFLSCDHVHRGEHNQTVGILAFLFSLTLQFLTCTCTLILSRMMEKWLGLRNGVMLTENESSSGNRQMKWVLNTSGSLLYSRYWKIQPHDFSNQTFRRLWECNFLKNELNINITVFYWTEEIARWFPCLGIIARSFGQKRRH